MKKYSFILISFLCLTAIVAQPTLGTLSYEEEKTYNGYNLLYAHNQPNVYLIDNCGDVVHMWADQDSFRPGNVAYLQSNGDLIKTKRPNASVNDPIWAGGGGATVEVLDWDNNLLSSFTLNNEKARLHHDIAITPESTVLMIAWELKSLDEAIEAGRDPDLITGGKLWPDYILEWDPIADKVIWEWHAWDHLIQDYDPSKNNFGAVSDHPELIDINYDEHDGHQDWLHANSIDYNATLDQILISVPYFNEVWIIDHSTTTEEASSHSGGNSGKGGDLLFRWGNPAAYRNGNEENKKFFFQHSIKWVDGSSQEGDPDFGLISLYNNRVHPDFSTLNVLNTGYNASLNEYKLSDGVFDPSDFQLSFVHPDTISIASSNSLSSMQVLPNGNLLAMAGRWGYAYELNPDNEVVWEYRVPIIRGQRGEQGTELEINNNITFRIERYGIDFEAFEGRDLLADRFRLELNPTAEICDVISATTERNEVKSTFKVLGNPSADRLILLSDDTDFVDIIDSNGIPINRVEISNTEMQLAISHLRSGVYYLRSNTGRVLKFIKM